MFTVYCLMDPCGLISNKDDDDDDFCMVTDGVCHSVANLLAHCAVALNLKLIYWMPNC